MDDASANTDPAPDTRVSEPTPAKPNGGNYSLALWIAMGMVLGSAVGTAMGVALGNLALGVAMGPAFGMSLGIAFYFGFNPPQSADADGATSRPDATEPDTTNPDTIDSGMSS